MRITFSENGIVDAVSGAAVIDGQQLGRRSSPERSRARPEVFHEVDVLLAATVAPPTTELLPEVLDQLLNGVVVVRVMVPRAPRLRVSLIDALLLEKTFGKGLPVEAVVEEGSAAQARVADFSVAVALGVVVLLNILHGARLGGVPGVS